MLLVPYIQIRANSIIAYQINEERNFSRSIQSLLTDNLRKQETYTGKLCPGAKKRLIKAIEFLVQSTPKRDIYNPVSRRVQPFQLSFITLTVADTSRNITGKEAHKNLLEPFLKWMRQTQNVRSYVWKAELQQRGQIHYHITADSFIHWRALRKKWNELQYRNGYLETHFAKYGNYDPPGCDVHSTKKVKNMARYLVKEIAKSFQNEESIGGKVWDCSMNLKAAKYFTTTAGNGFYSQMYDDPDVRAISTDHCTIYEFKDKPAYTALLPDQLQNYKKYMVDVRNHGIIPPKENKPKPVLYDIIPIRLLKTERPPNLFSNYQDCRCEVMIDTRCFSSS